MGYQHYFFVRDDFEEFDVYLRNSGHKRILLVCGNSIKYFKIGSYFHNLQQRTGIRVVQFSDYTPNPKYESVVNGVRILTEEKCTLIVGVGGGSTIDVAKCIKLFSNMDSSKNYLQQTIVPNDTELIVMPTTAGTGSEATRFSVIYFEGEKQSVTDDSCIPSGVLVDPSVLESLPIYEKKSSMLDAFCHAMESFWSIHSTEESRELSKLAIRIIMANKDEYLNNTRLGNSRMLKAANIAGRAINITQTTAGHAMCYKITTLYGIAHGHAAALCVSKLFPYMICHMNKCIDPRGEKYLKKIFEEIADAMGCASIEAAIRKYDELFSGLQLQIPKAKEEDYVILKNSVNTDRLNNNPVKLDEEAIDLLYHQIFMNK